MKSEYYECDCGGHVLRVYTLEEDKNNIVYMDKMQNDSIGQTVFIRRVKLALGYIFKPKKYSIFGDFIFTRQVARKLGEDLMKATAEKPNDLITGEK